MLFKKLHEVSRFPQTKQSKRIFIAQNIELISSPTLIANCLREINSVTVNPLLEEYESRYEYLHKSYSGLVGAIEELQKWIQKPEQLELFATENTQDETYIADLTYRIQEFIPFSIQKRKIKIEEAHAPSDIDLAYRRFKV